MTPQDKQEIAQMCAQAVVWGHFNVDGVDGWTVGGALSHVAKDVWNEDLAGVRARDRVVGTDIAANNVNNCLPFLMDAITKACAANGVDISGIAGEVQKAVKESLEKISLNVEVK